MPDIDLARVIQGGIDILDQQTCPSFGLGLDLIFSMTKDSVDGYPHISARKFPVPTHLHPVIEAFDYPDDIPTDDRVIVGVKVLALLPYRRYVLGLHRGNH